MDDSPIWFLTHEFTPFRGGAATYVRETAGAIRQMAVDARVLAPDYRGRFPLVEDAAVQRFPGSGKLGPAGVVEMAAGIWRHRHALAGAPVIAGSAGALMALILLDRVGMFRPDRLLCFLHGSEILKLRQRPFWRVMVPAFFRRWPHVGVASKYVLDLWLDGLEARVETVHLAPCACSEAFLARADAAVTVPRPVPPDGDLVVLTLARLHPRKGQAFVAHALGLLPAALRQRVCYRIVGAGSESYRQMVRNACAAADVRCIFTEAAADEELAKIYFAATVYAQASVSLPESVEGFGITYLEAAACGLPVAAWASGGTAEAVIDGHTGLLAPEGDVKALALNLQRLLEDAGLRARFSEAGREHARSFRWSASARTLVDAVRRAFPIGSAVS